MSLNSLTRFNASVIALAMLGACSSDSGSGPAPTETPVPPVANAGGPYQGEQTIAFDGSKSTDPKGPGLTDYLWSFGDSTQGSGATPTHTYETSGTYQVSLVVKNGVGSQSQPATTTAAVAIPPAVLLGAGNIASCDRVTDEKTARLLDSLPGTVMTLGDNAYLTGTAEDYAHCYGPSWGRHRSRTFPAPGNHEYDVDPAVYFSYFGAAAGDPTKGYYSYDLGEWHIIVLNSASTTIPTDPASAQIAWLKADLAASKKQCTLAYWHHPRFYQGDWGKNARVKFFWDVLYDKNVDVVVNGHFHMYERYAPQTPDGVVNTDRGMREFIAGTGGIGKDSLEAPNPNVEVRDNSTYGVVKFTLRAGGYDWEFVPVAGGKFTDAGSGTCH